MNTERKPPHFATSGSGSCARPSSSVGVGGIVQASLDSILLARSMSMSVSSATAARPLREEAGPSPAVLQAAAGANSAADPACCWQRLSVASATTEHSSTSSSNSSGVGGGSSVLSMAQPPNSGSFSSQSFPAPHPTQLVPEIAHRIRNLEVIRFKDQQRVTMESLWNKRVAAPGGGDGSTSLCGDTVSGEGLTATPAVLYRAPSLGDAPDTNAPIVETANGRPVLVCLFRRWGCCVCRMTAASLSSLRPFLDERGIQLVGVGFETIGLKKFVEAGHFGGELYLDPSRSLYRRIECRMTTWRTLWGAASMEVLGLYKQANKRHYAVDFEGDFSQLGAVFLIDANGATRYLQIQTEDKFQIDTLKILETIGVTPPEDYDPLPDAHKKSW